MEALIGIGGVLLILAVFGGLSRLNSQQQRRMLADVTRPTITPTRRFDLTGDLLPREETALGPVEYRRIPEAPAAYLMEHRRAQYQPTVESAFVVPVLQATATAVAATVAFAVA